MVLAESLVDTDIGVRPRPWSWSGDVRVRPLGASSDGLLVSVEGRLGSGDGCLPSRDISLESLLRSMDGRPRRESAACWPSCVLDEELEGLVGGDGGA